MKMLFPLFIYFFLRILKCLVFCYPEVIEIKITIEWFSVMCSVGDGLV